MERKKEKIKSIWSSCTFNYICWCNRTLYIY